MQRRLDPDDFAVNETGAFGCATSGVTRAGGRKDFVSTVGDSLPVVENLDPLLITLLFDRLLGT